MPLLCGILVSDNDKTSSLRKSLVSLTKDGTL